MGLLFPHRIGPSSVHGRGLFSTISLDEGAILWRFEPGLEERRLLRELAPGERRRLLHYGYINPEHPDWLVICGDDARYWNFPPPGEEPNSCLGSLLYAGEPVVVAARTIAAGEELLIEAASDADYARKMGLVAHPGSRREETLHQRFPSALVLAGETAGGHP